MSAAVARNSKTAVQARREKPDEDMMTELAKYTLLCFPGTPPYNPVMTAVLETSMGSKARGYAFTDPQTQVALNVKKRAAERALQLLSHESWNLSTPDFVESCTALCEINQASCWVKMEEKVAAFWKVQDSLRPGQGHYHDAPVEKRRARPAHIFAPSSQLACSASRTAAAAVQVAMNGLHLWNCAADYLRAQSEGREYVAPEAYLLKDVIGRKYPVPDGIILSATQNDTLCLKYHEARNIVARRVEETLLMKNEAMRFFEYHYKCLKSAMDDMTVLGSVCANEAAPSPPSPPPPPQATVDAMDVDPPVAPAVEEPPTCPSPSPPPPPPSEHSATDFLPPSVKALLLPQPAADGSPGAVPTISPLVVAVSVKLLGQAVARAKLYELDAYCTRTRRMINRARKLWVETGLPRCGKRKSVPPMGFSILPPDWDAKYAALLGGDVAQDEMPDSDDTNGEDAAELMAEEEEEVPFVDPTPADIMAASAAETTCGGILDWDNPGTAAAPEIVLDYGNID